jgi:ribosomal protein L27
MRWQVVGRILDGAKNTFQNLPLAALATGVADTAATASTLALRDGNANLTADAFIPTAASTVTAAATTTLTINDAQVQVFTGSTTQTVKLPTTGVTAGQQYTVCNQSSGAVTVQSSGANTIVVLNANKVGVFTAVVSTPTTAAHWIGSAPTPSGSVASTVAMRDSNASLLGVAFVVFPSSTVTAAGTTTLTVASPSSQVFTGSTTQTVKLPTTGVVAGQQYTIANQSSGAVTVQSSDATTISTVAANSVTLYIAIVSTPTTGAHWRAI